MCLVAAVGGSCSTCCVSCGCDIVCGLFVARGPRRCRRRRVFVLLPDVLLLLAIVILRIHLLCHDHRCACVLMPLNPKP